MSKPFIKTFYNSRAWKGTRERYISERVLIDGGICEECLENVGEEVHHIIELTIDNLSNHDITLNFDNLVLLCKACHFKKHKITRFARDAKIKRLTDNGYYFDEIGDLKPVRVFVVYGSPGSGKSTYVKDNKEYGDLVVDLDLIKQAISMCGTKETPDNLLDTAITMRELLYDLIEKRKTDARNVWVIASLPDKAKRSELIERFKAEPVFIDTSMDECIAHVLCDDDRIDKEKHVKLVKKWFEEYC